jgi:hypothetical protein
VEKKEIRSTNKKVAFSTPWGCKKRHLLSRAQLSMKTL